MGWPGFILGLCGWFFILFEVFAGGSSKASASLGDKSEAVKKSFANMRIIVSVGWSIYPLGYFLGFLTGVARPPSTSSTTLPTWSTRSASCLLAGLPPRRTPRSTACSPEWHWLDAFVFRHWLHFL